MDQPKRGALLTIFALLFALLALSNLSKPLEWGETTGFVLFGFRLSGLANAIVGPLFGIFLAVYAYGIWKMKRWAMPMSHAYATYVVINLLIWNLRYPPTEQSYGLGFMLIYLIIAIGVSVGAAIVLTRRREELV
jgi:hypothetical protein